MDRYLERAESSWAGCRRLGQAFVRRSTPSRQGTGPVPHDFQRPRPDRRRDNETGASALLEKRSAVGDPGAGSSGTSAPTFRGRPVRAPPPVATSSLRAGPTTGRDRQSRTERRHPRRRGAAGGAWDHDGRIPDRSRVSRQRIAGWQRWCAGRLAGQDGLSGCPRPRRRGPSQRLAEVDVADCEGWPTTVAGHPRLGCEAGQRRTPHTAGSVASAGRFGSSSLLPAPSKSYVPFLL